MRALDGGRMSYESINQHPDPRCTRIRTVWNAIGQKTGSKYRYELQSGATPGSVFCWNPLPSMELKGKVLFARVTGTQFVIDRLGVEAATTIAKADTWIAARVADDNTSNHTICVNNGTVVLEEVGVYTPDDWQHLYELYRQGEMVEPWFAPPINGTAQTKYPVS